jgi:hypothetical protein
MAGFGSNVTLSHNRLSTFIQCRRKFKYSYIDKKMSRKIPKWIIFGSAIDAAMQFYFQKIGHMVDGDLIAFSIDQFLDVFMNDSSFTKVDWTMGAEDVDGETIRDEMASNGIGLLESFHDQYFSICLKWTEVRTQLAVPQFQVGSYLTEGYLDLFYKDDGIPYILDFKTSAKSIKDQFDKYHFQMLYYSSCFGRMLKGKSLYCKIVGFIKDTGKIETLDFRFTNAHYVQFFENLEMVSKELEFAVENENYPMTFNKQNCNFCDFINMCWSPGRIDNLIVDKQPY